jgi:hypothetical protein
MKTHLAYCSACDRDVSIVITDEPHEEGQAPITGAELVCLDIGERCTGALCPIGATPPVVMAARLVRNGLHTTMQPIVKARCPGCDRVTDQVVLDARSAICSECGTTSSRDSLDISR